MYPNSKRDVVIIGGGLAGLASAEAIQLASKSCRITLLEAKRTTGGRAGSFQDQSSGELIDYCQHVTMGCCTNLLSLLDRAGQLDLWQRIEEFPFLAPRSRESRFGGSNWLPAPLHLFPTLVRLHFLSWEQRCQVLFGMWRMMRATPEFLVDQTALDWLSANRQSQSTIRLFWNTILVSALGDSAQHVAMSAARKVFIDGFVASCNASDIYIPQRPLAELFGIRLPDYLRKIGVEIRTSQIVRSLREVETDSRFEIETDTETYLADHVILATSPQALTHINIQTREVDRFRLPEQLHSLPYASISGVHLWLDREITSEQHVAFSNMLAQWLFRAPFVNPNDHGHYYQVIISGSQSIDHLDAREVVSRLLQELPSVLPLARDVKVLRYKVVTDPFAVFSIRPKVHASRPSSLTPLTRLTLAGDYIQTGWPATMEGAVISGRMAAREVLILEGRTLSIDPGLPKGRLARWLIN